MTTETTTEATTETTYRVTVDLDACDGVFACLVRDDRFVEADDGLVGFDPADAINGAERTTNELDGDERRADAVSATFEDDRIDDARQAAAACPLDAITVEEEPTDIEEEPTDIEEEPTDIEEVAP